MDVCYGYLLYKLINELFSNLLGRVNSILLEETKLATIMGKKGGLNIRVIVINIILTFLSRNYVDFICFVLQ